jgi:hypothetical protein
MATHRQNHFDPVNKEVAPVSPVPIMNASEIHLSTPSVVSRWESATDSSKSRKAESLRDTYSGSKLRAAESVMQTHDLRNISRRDLVALGDKLYESGVISGEQRLELTAPYREKFNPNMERITDPDEKRNFLTDVSDLLDYTKRFRSEDRSSIAHLEKLNNLASSLAEIG